MNLPTPAELGMPAKFADVGWRPVQEEMLRFLLGSTKRTKAACAPTGSGKSAVGVGYALMLGEPTVYVTDSRSLQDQLMHDFAEIGLVDLRGRKNYVCPLKPDYSCEEGYAASCPYKGTIECPSSQAEMRAAVSRLVVTNYAKWTSAKKFGRGMEHFTCAIFDEGHETVNALSNAMQVVVNHRERERHIALDPPPYPEDMLNWKPWAVEARATVEGLLKAAQDKLRMASDPRPGAVRHMLHMRNLYRRLGILATANPNNWIVEEIDIAGESKGFQFDPVRPGRYAESALMLRVPNVIVMSATLRPKTLFLIGQGKDTFDFKEFDSSFDPKRNPVYWIPTMRVDARAHSLVPLWNRLDQIAARRRDRNGIVHTVSYLRRDEIVSTSRFAPQMLVNPRGEAPTEMVELFKASPAGTILVSPSVGQGHDFPGTTCEWQFLCKVPFPPPSKILKARTVDDPELPYYLAMLKLVQVFGRGCRFGDKRQPDQPHDSCENFIADDHVEWFLNRYGHLAPRSFHMVFKKVEFLPAPLPSLREGV